MCVAGALLFIEADERSLKRAMSLGSARFIIESISRRSRTLDLVMTGPGVSGSVTLSLSSSNSLSSRSVAPYGSVSIIESSLAGSGLRRSCNEGAGRVIEVALPNFGKIRWALWVYLAVVPPMPLVQYCCS